MCIEIYFFDSPLRNLSSPKGSTSVLLPPWRWNSTGPSRADCCEKLDACVSKRGACGRMNQKRKHAPHWPHLCPLQNSRLACKSHGPEVGIVGALVSVLLLRLVLEWEIVSYIIYLFMKQRFVIQIISIVSVEST